MVEQFIKKYTPLLISNVEAFLIDRITSNEFKAFLNKLDNEWVNIPLEETQIPYLPTESEFWLLTSMSKASVSPELDVVHNAVAIKEMRDALQYLSNGGKLPDGYSGRRPLGNKP